MIRTLIVDDSKTNRDILIRALGRAFPTPSEPFEFTQAEDGTRALDLIEANEPFDLILTGWNMPFMSGLELFVALKNPPPTVFVSSQLTEPQYRQGKDAGAKAFITKPYTPDIVKSVLSTILGTRVQSI